MTAHDLLERRAERGTSRGAANVWANAQPTNEGAHGRAPWIFRLAVASIVGIVGIASYVALSETQTQRLDATNGESIALSSSEPLPEPILVDGMDLTQVFRPVHPDFDADDLFGTGDKLEDFGDIIGTEEIVVFAAPDDPFDNPIVGFTTFDDGGFQTFVANVDEDQKNRLMSEISLVNGTPTLSPSSGLVEVETVGRDPQYGYHYGWSSEFSDGDATIELTSFTSPNLADLDIWSDLAWRLSNDEGVITTTRSVDVLGQQGVLVTSSNGEFDDVVWQDGEFVYTVSRWSTDEFEQPILSSLPSLTLAERGEWISAVRDADTSRSLRPSIWDFLGFVVVGAVATSATNWLVKARRRRNNL